VKARVAFTLFPKQEPAVFAHLKILSRPFPAHARLEINGPNHLPVS
jgi:hypothetical protein